MPLAQEMISDTWFVLTMLSWAAMIAGMGGYAWVLAYTRIARGGSLLAGDHEPSPIGFLDIVSSFVCWLSCQLAAGVALVALNGGEMSLAEMTSESVARFMLLSALSQLFATVLIAGFLFIRYKRVSAVGLRPKRWLKDIKIGLVGYVMIIPGVMFIQWLLSILVPYEHPTLKLLSEKPSFFTLGVCWVAAVLVAPLTEEFFFRGVVQNWLQRLNASVFRSNEVLLGGYDGLVHDDPGLNRDRENDVEVEVAETLAEESNPYRSPPTADLPFAGNEVSKGSEPPMWPIFATSFIFALMHFGQGAAPVALFFLSLGLGFLYRQTSSIVPCFIVHLLLNGFTMFWFTISVIFGETP